MVTEDQELGKEAYTLAQQLEALYVAMKEAGDHWGGYRSFATTYAVDLVRARELLASSPTIARTIAHLRSYDPNKATGYGRDFEQIKADLPVLKAALESFALFSLPAKEKKRIGFNSI